MKRLRDNKHTLHVLKNCKPSVRKSIIKFGNSELIKTLCEICINVLNGNVKIPLQSKLKLKNYKNSLRKLASPRIGLNSKKKILVQKGGFLPILLSTLLSSVIGSLIEKNINSK